MLGWGRNDVGNVCVLPLLVSPSFIDDLLSEGSSLLIIFCIFSNTLLLDIVLALVGAVVNIKKMTETHNKAGQKPECVHAADTMFSPLSEAL